MDIYLYKNSDELNKLNKTLTSELPLSGYLRTECAIENPVIMIESSTSLNEYNYFYIPDFGRYYFRTGLDIVRNNLYRLAGKTDVLMSFKTDIQNFDAILNQSENFGAIPYAQSSVWQALVKTKTDIKMFPSGLSDDGEFILITAGG